MELLAGIRVVDHWDSRISLARFQGASVYLGAVTTAGTTRTATNESFAPTSGVTFVERNRTSTGFGMMLRLASTDYVSLCVAITNVLGPLHASLFKFRIRKRLLSRLRPMRPLVVRGVGRVLAYRACPFRVVIGYQAFACGSRFACCLPRGLDKLIIEAERGQFVYRFLGPRERVSLRAFQ
jgi:hypothetical protein